MRRQQTVLVLRIIPFYVQSATSLLFSLVWKKRSTETGTAFRFDVSFSPKADLISSLPLFRLTTAPTSKRTLGNIFECPVVGYRYITRLIIDRSKAAVRRFGGRPIQILLGPPSFWFLTVFYRGELLTISLDLPIFQIVFDEKVWAWSHSIKMTKMTTV